MREMVAFIIICKKKYISLALINLRTTFDWFLRRFKIFMFSPDIGKRVNSNISEESRHRQVEWARQTYRQTDE